MYSALPRLPCDVHSNHRALFEAGGRHATPEHSLIPGLCTDVHDHCRLHASESHFMNGYAAFVPICVSSAEKIANRWQGTIR